MQTPRHVGACIKQNSGKSNKSVYHNDQRQETAEKEYVRYKKGFCDINSKTFRVSNENNENSTQ